MKILLVDDDSFLLDMYTVKFTKAGYNVVSVKDADQALTVLREGATFDGALLDIVLPGMSGLELLRIIKKESLGGPHCKCIMLSNQGEQFDITAAKELGATGYIVKAEAMPGEVVDKVAHILTT